MDGRPLPHASTKIAALLKAIVALGPEPVAQERLAYALWPDSDARSARRVFDTTLHRLRRWLGVPAAVSLVRGNVQLLPELCWVDAHAFRNGVAPSQELSGETLVSSYHGKFLPDCGYEWWAESPRDAIHARFLRIVIALGREREHAREWQCAITLYERALEVDDLFEPVHQGLIRCQLALGHRAEALRAYERCKRRLLQTLAAAPNEHTEALAGRARSSGALLSGWS